MKIIGSDYDGTLSYGGMNDTKLSAIRKWRKAGHKFGIVSGRGGDFRQNLLKNNPQLELDFFAACNGGYITDGNGAVIYEKRCSEVPILDLLTDLLDLGCRFIHVIGERYMCVVAREEDRPSDVSECDVYLLEKIPPIDYFNQISVQLPTAEDAAAVAEKILENYKKWLNPLQNGKCVDIVPVGVNKAEGLYRVMEIFGCSHDDVIAVGDNINDIDMIQQFHSYAMKSGVREVQKLADGIVSDVTELIEKELSF